MGRIPKESIKDWFKTGDRPTEEEFSKLIDECYNIDNAATIDDIIRYVASCGFVTLEEFINMYHEITEEEANRLMDEIDIEGLWTLNINTATYEVTMDGDINAWLTYRDKLGRYAMTNDGKARKLNRDDSSLLEDGSEYDASSVHIMTRFPRLYFTCVNDGDLVTITLSESKFTGCKSFEEQWIGSYLGAIVDNALVSRSGISPRHDSSIYSFWKYAQVNGSDWGLSDYHQRQMMIVVYLCEYLAMNSQLNLGLGMTGNGNNWTHTDGSPVEVVINAKTGATSVLGDRCGKVAFTESGQTANGACHVSLFGVEDPYGWFDEVCQGVYFGSSENEGQDGTECYIYDGNRIPSSTELSTHPSGIYRQITRLTSGGWIKKLMWGPNLDIIPAELGGSTVYGHGDFYRSNTTGQMMLCGGYAAFGASCGIALSYPQYPLAILGTSIGARLAYYGKADIV